ncbi:MAG: universal stress protein [Candidatus Binatia bacterium]
MTRLKKIVAPVDFSKNSRAGLRFAASLAAENGAELIVLHVADEFQTWEIPDELGLLSDKVYRWEADKILKEAALDLSAFLQRHADELRRVPAGKKRVILGGVAENIITVAAEEEADLIVMSPRAHGAFRRFFLGSVTDKVTRRAPCPVLSVCPRPARRRPSGKRIPLIGGMLQGSEA